MLAGPPGSQRPVWQDASEDVFADDSDEEFTPEELSLVQELLTPERFLRVWAALHDLVDSALSKREPSSCSTRWYRVLKQHHTACLHSSSQPAQLTQGVCTPGSSALSDHSAESAIVPFTGTAVNITNRRLFKSTTPPRDQKGLLLPSTAASAANFSQRLSHAAVNPHQLYAYDSSEGDTGQPSKSMEEQNSLQSFPQPASSTDSTTTASPAESAPQSDSAAESTHKPDVQSLHKPDSELSTVTDAACTPRLWQGPTQQAALASVIHATASPPTHVMGSSPRMASAASIEHVHEQGTATLEDEDTQPFRGALSVQPRVLRHKKAAHAVTPRGQQVQHGFLVGKQQWGSLQLPQRIIAHDLSSSSEPSQPSIRSQHSMPPWSHGPAARHVTQRSRGTHGQAANAGRVATRSARKLLDNRTADSAQSNSFSGNPKQGSGVHSASRHTELLSESDDGSESETNLPEATPQRTRRGNSAGQLPQQLPEQVLGQSIRQLARQPTQPGASQQTSRQTSKQLLQLSSGHLSHETPQQAGMQSPTTEETRSPGSTPSQIQGLAKDSSQEGEGESPVCSAVIAAANRLQAVQAGLASAEQRLAELSGTNKLQSNLYQSRSSAHDSLSADSGSENEPEWMQKAFMQSGTDASAQASPVQPQSSGLIRQVPDKGSLQGLVPSMCLVADSDAPLETEAAPRQLSVRRRLSMVSETDEQEERHLGDAAVQEEDAQEIASEYLVISRQVESDFGQSLPDNVIEQQSPGQLQGTADNESGLSKYIEKQSQEQLEQMLQQQLLKQLQQQWQPQSEENNGVQGHPAGQNLDRLEMQHAAGTPNVNEATVEVQSLALITTPADDWGQSAGEEGQVSAMSVRQRMQAALQAVHAAEKAVDAAVVFRPRVE